MIKTAAGFLIAEGYVEIETKYDGRTIGRISQQTGQRAGNRFIGGFFSQSSHRRFQKLLNQFFKPIDRMAAMLGKIRMPAIFAGLASSILAMLPSLTLASSAVGAGIVPAFLSWGTSIGIVRALLGRLDKSIESQLMKRIDGLAKGIKQIALETAKPGLNAFFKEALTHAPLLEKYVREIARSVSNVGFSMAKVLDRSSNLAKIRIILDGVARATAAWHTRLDEAAEVVLTIAAAGTPLFEKFVQQMLRVADTVHAWVLLQYHTGRLQKFLVAAYRELEKWGTIGKNILLGLFNIFSAGIGPSSKFTDNLVRISGQFRAWTAESENIEKVRRVLQWLVDHVGAFFRLAAAATVVSLALKGIASTRGLFSWIDNLKRLGPLALVLNIAGAAVAGMGLAFFLAFNRSELFRKKTREIWEMIKTRLGPILRDWGIWIRDTLLPILDQLALKGLAKVGTELDKLLTKIEDNQEGLKELRPLFILLAQASAFLARGLVEEVVGAINQVITAFGWIGRGVGAVRVAFINLQQWAGTAVDKVAEFFRLLPGRLVGFLKNLPKLLAQSGRAGLEGLVTAVGYGLGTLFNLFVKVPGEIKKIFDRTWKGARDNSGQWMLNILKFIGTFPDKAFTALGKLKDRITVRFSTAWKGSQDASSRWVINILKFIAGFPDRAFTALRMLRDRLVRRFAEGWSAATGQQASKVVAILNYILGIPGRAYNALRALPGRLAARARESWDAFKSWTARKTLEILGMIGRWGDRIGSFFATLAKRAPGWGSRMWSNVVRGIRSIDLVGAMKGILNRGIGMLEGFISRVADGVNKALPGSPVPKFKLPRLQQGGILPGNQHGPNRDSVPWMGVPGEMVLQRPSVRELVSRFGTGVLDWLNNAHRWPHSADVAGDAGTLVLRRQQGGLIPKVQNWIRRQDPRPYCWGGHGPGCFDCSGLAGAVWGMLAGRNPFQRYFTTSSIGRFGGLKPGRGTYTIGVTPGRGHMAGNLAGLPFEARSSRAGIIVGSGAKSVTSFARQFYMPQVGGQFIGGGGGGGNIFSSLVNKIVGAAERSVMGLLNKFAGGSTVGKVISAVGGTAVKSIGNWVRSLASFTLPTGGAGTMAAGAALTNWIRAAIQMTGVPMSWGPAILRRIRFESGGNPRAVNRYDSNARRGTPSMGLMQTIEPTFRAYHEPGTSWNIFDPVANIAAAINYILARYKTIFAIDPPIKGYLRGTGPGGLPEDIMGWGLGRRGGRYLFHQGERVTPNNTSVAHQGNVIHYHFAPGAIQIEARSVKEFTDVIEMLNNLKPTARMFQSPRRAVA